MPGKKTALLVAAVTVALAASGCSSSKSSTSSQGAGTTAPGATAAATGGTIKIGVITDSTGVASSGYSTTEKGVKAYVNYINSQGGINGNKVSYVMGDSTSTPTGALTAAQKLVQKDKVFAILSVTSDFYGAEAYLLKAGVPVIGTGFDGPEWEVQSNTNMLDAIGPSDPKTVYTTTGMIMKAYGATKCSTVGYIESPSSADSSVAGVNSCKAAGLQTLAANEVSFGTTDMTPTALKMKDSGVNGIYMGTVPNTGFSLAGALKQNGIQPKLFLLATGYGGDLLKSTAAVAAAQGFQFSSNGEPVEANTPATQLEVKNLAAGGEAGTPTYAEQTAYISLAAFAAALKATGPNPTQKSFITAMRTVKGFDADGLLAPEKVDFASYAPTQSCAWVVTLEGSKFVPDKNNPYCGTKIG
jgi:branched-chain amino acid transport system substrate-binding protein